MSAACGQWTVTSTDEEGVRTALPILCRSWTCPSCAPKLKRRLLRRLSGVKVYSLITLTCDPSRWDSPDAAWHGMSHSVDTLFKRLRRYYPDSDIQYFLTWEATKLGWPHAHLLLRGPFLPKEWLSRTWAELTGAPIVDIRRVTDPYSVISYIAKYLTKDPTCPFNFKRYRSSRRFFDRMTPAALPTFRAKAPWRFTTSSPREIAARWSADGLTVHHANDGTVTAYPRGHPNAPLRDSVAGGRQRGETYPCAPPN